MTQRHRLATLVESRGTRVRVLSGRVWIAEDGIAHERLVPSGEEYVVQGVGRVRVEQEAIDGRGQVAQIALSSPCALPNILRVALAEAELPQMPVASLMRSRQRR